MTISERDRILGIAREAYKSLASLPESYERDDLAIAFVDIAVVARDGVAKGKPLMCSATLNRSLWIRARIWFVNRFRAPIRLEGAGRFALLDNVD